MKGSNSLTSHHGESHAFRADKMIPKETLRNFRTHWKTGAHKMKAGVSKFWKKFYNRKNRHFNKKIDDNFI